MRIYLTGSTGLLGSHILKEGLERGHHFVCPVRKINKRCFLHEVRNQVTIIEGDLLQENIDLKEIDTIINCAALASPFEEDSHAMEEINFKFVKKIYKSFLSSKANTFIQISSIATMNNGDEDFVINEERKGNCRETNYAKSKKNADDWLDSNLESDIDEKRTIIIHPCYMLGNYDSRPSSGAILFALKLNKISKYTKNIKNFVHAKDVARGILMAMEKKSHGHYILGGENLSLKDFFEYTLKSLNIEKILNLADPSGLNNIEKEFCLSSPVSCEKSEKDFNYKAEYDVKEMLSDTISYFESKKMLRVKKNG